MQLMFGGKEFRLRPVMPDDSTEVLRLYTTVFGTSLGNEWYEWKYAAGHGEAVGLWDTDGCLVAHYAGFPRSLVWMGFPVTSIQVGDVMVAPRQRALLMRRGPFYRVCEHFVTSRVGANKRFSLAFGFPNERHFRLGVMLGLYDNAGPVHRLVWSTRNVNLGWQWRWTEITPKELIAIADPVWAKMRADFTEYVLGTRDAAYLNWRFATRPDRRYRFFALQRRPFRSTVALAVMRTAPGEAELLDIIGPRRALRPLLLGAIGEAFRNGATTLSAWASPSAASTLAPTGATIAGRAASLAIAPASDLRGASNATTIPWWWLGGDTDFL